MWIEPKAYRRLGGALAAIRKRAGVTQDELATRLRKPQSFISTYECGQRRIDVLELLVILDALKADPEKVFAGIAAAGRKQSQR